MNRRREFLIVLGLTAVLLPAPALSQKQSKVWRIGMLSSGSLGRRPLGEFVRGMQALGYMEGKDFVMEWRSAEGEYNRLPTLAAELVRLKVDVIVAWASPAIRAAQKATTTIPIVFPTTGDPVGAGFVASLARPGGNITGLSNSNLDVSAKLVELLLAVTPKLSRVAVLSNPGSSTQPEMLKSIEAASKKLGIQVLAVNAKTPKEIELGFVDMAREGVGAVIIGADSFLSDQRQLIAALAMKYRLPSITQSAAYTEAGGLMSYGHDARYGFRRAATYVDKILKGEKPGELPVEQPTKFQLVINRKTAKALGLTISQELRLRADTVIE